MGGDATEKRIGETGTHRDRILAGEGVIVLERRRLIAKRTARDGSSARSLRGATRRRGDARVKSGKRPSVKRRAG